MFNSHFENTGIATQQQQQQRRRQPKLAIEKWAMISLKRGKVCQYDGIKLSDGRETRLVHHEKLYKCLGMLEDNIPEEQYCFRKFCKILKSKLNGGNAITATNNWAVSATRYGEGILEWTLSKLNHIDRKKANLLLMTTYRVLYPNGDLGTLYLPRKGGRGLIASEEYILKENKVRDKILAGNWRTIAKSCV